MEKSFHSLFRLQMKGVHTLQFEILSVFPLGSKHKQIHCVIYWGKDAKHKKRQVDRHT